MIDYLRARLAYEADVLEVAKGLRAGTFIVVDTRKQESWDHGHVPGAVHAPSVTSDSELRALFPTDDTIVVYGWGPGCNGGTHAALRLAELGYSVREMIGGFEYWCRNGLPVESASGAIRHLPDPLVTAER
jgi:rhodanese-related sulfurtransferase